MQKNKNDKTLAIMPNRAFQRNAKSFTFVVR